MGIVVSKKVGKAVVRNLVRRRLREALRALCRQQGLASADLGSADVVIIARPEAATASYHELKDNLRLALKKGQLL